MKNCCHPEWFYAHDCNVFQMGTFVIFQWHRFQLILTGDVAQFPFLWRQETTLSPGMRFHTTMLLQAKSQNFLSFDDRKFHHANWRFYTGMLIILMLAFEQLFTTAFHRYVSKCPAGLHMIKMFCSFYQFFLTCLNGFVVWCLKHEDGKIKTFCKVSKKGPSNQVCKFEIELFKLKWTVQMFVNQLPV